MRIAVAAMVGMAALSGCARATAEVSYRDMVAAQRQDAVKREWVPSMLPEQTTDIRAFRAPREGIAMVEAQLDAGILPDACVLVDTAPSPPAFDDLPDWAVDLTGGTAVRCVGDGDHSDEWDGSWRGSRIVLWSQAEDDTG